MMCEMEERNEAEDMVVKKLELGDLVFEDADDDEFLTEDAGVAYKNVMTPISYVSPESMTASRGLNTAWSLGSPSVPRSAHTMTYGVAYYTEPLALDPSTASSAKKRSATIESLAAPRKSLDGGARKSLDCRRYCSMNTRAADLGEVGTAVTSATYSDLKDGSSEDEAAHGMKRMGTLRRSRGSLGSAGKTKSMWSRAQSGGGDEEKDAEIVVIRQSRTTMRTKAKFLSKVFNRK